MTTYKLAAGKSLAVNNKVLGPGQIIDPTDLHMPPNALSVDVNGYTVPLNPALNPVWLGYIADGTIVVA